ncbi:hypothetical protein MG293_018088 [Ovis ammon polii]|uniref:Uncharacterized protein n=1 Tax=Ovis ammon polii TaxID=230172 RepID=A0AAD4TSQ5_OVIAM|nr:hypothetical protein MG293_018088 [Ovis ammon polii]
MSEGICASGAAREPKVNGGAARSNRMSREEDGFLGGFLAKKKSNEESITGRAVIPRYSCVECGQREALAGLQRHPPQHHALEDQTPSNSSAPSPKQAEGNILEMKLDRPPSRGSGSPGKGFRRIDEDIVEESKPDLWNQRFQLQPLHSDSGVSAVTTTSSCLPEDEDMETQGESAFTLQ